MSGVNILTDPAEISKQANALFADKQFARAAELHQRLLDFDPENSHTYNNLGLTLYYIGRSEETIAKLNEGAALDTTNQHICLSLCFVRNQLGNNDSAIQALSKAIELGPDTKVGQSAAKMLEDLP